MTTDPPDPALELVNAAMIAKIAGSLGAPRLAIAAARQARELASVLTISLSPMLAATTVETEDDRLGDVRTTRDLAALLRPEPTEETT